MNNYYSSSKNDNENNLTEAKMKTESQIKIRVYYEDTDCSGRVYHASYIRFFERGRTEFLRDLGLNHDYFANDCNKDDEKGFFAVHKMNVTYSMPACLDDELVVKTKLLEVKGARFILYQSIENSKGYELCNAEVSVVFLNENGKPSRLPDILKIKLSSL